MIPENEWAGLREDVGYIKAKIEVIDKLDDRVSALEKKWWQFPMTAIFALLGSHFGN